MKISGIKEFFLLYCGEWEAMEGKGGYGIAGIRRFFLEKNWWAHQDSNLGPTGYEPVALAN